MNSPAIKSSVRNYPEAVSVVRRAGPSRSAAGETDSFPAIRTWLLEEASSEREMIHLLLIHVASLGLGIGIALSTATVAIVLVALFWQ